MVADFWSGLDPTDPTGSAGPVMAFHCPVTIKLAMTEFYDYM